MKVLNTVHLIILNEENRVLLLKRSDAEKYFADCWSIPGGHLEENETFEEGLIREIKEEINCEISEKNYFRSYYYVLDQNVNTRNLYFYGRIKGEIKLNEENIEFKWVSEFEINSLDIGFNQKDVLVDFIKIIKNKL